MLRQTNTKKKKKWKQLAQFIIHSLLCSLTPTSIVFFLPLLSVPFYVLRMRCDCRILNWLLKNWLPFSVVLRCGEGASSVMRCVPIHYNVCTEWFHFTKKSNREGAKELIRVKLKMYYKKRVRTPLSNMLQRLGTVPNFEKLSKDARLRIPMAS